MDQLPTITDERANQYKTKRNAQYYARNYNRITGKSAFVIQTRTWRNLVPHKCWMVVEG